MIAAVYELNGKILKTTNLTKKLKRLKSEPKILYQIENGSEADLDKWLYKADEDDNEEVIKLYHYINKSNGYTKTSIYDNLDDNVNWFKV